jgi:hypothetical protein
MRRVHDNEADEARVRLAEAAARMAVLVAALV